MMSLTCELVWVKRIWILYWISYIVSLLCIQNTLIVTDFEILKYIKKIFKVRI